MIVASALKGLSILLYCQGFQDIFEDSDMIEQKKNNKLTGGWGPLVGSVGVNV